MIDWRKIATGLAPGSPADASRVQATPVSGGDINRGYRLQLGDRRYFVKLNRPDRKSMFEAEARGLEAILESGAIRAPKVVKIGGDDEHAWLVLEYIELSGALAPEDLARALAALHACQSAQFGFDTDNTIGSTPQPNPLSGDWIEFWRDQRLGFQLLLARDNGLPGELVDAGFALAEDLPCFFCDYLPAAALLHGDLWSGNYGADERGRPVIYDPACYYGDHEADLAMMELFGNPGARFFACYHEQFAIDDGYPLRRDLYNLYHLLNHANLFGGGYVNQSGRVIERLRAEIR